MITAHEKYMANRQVLEEVVLGVVLMENKYFAICNILKGDNFSGGDRYGCSHRDIWNACAWISEHGGVVDIISVTGFMRGQFRNPDDFVGAFYISELTNKVSSSANLEYWCMCLLEIDIREKFENLIVGLKNSCGPDEGVMKAHYDEVLIALADKEDIFDCIGACYDGMKELGAVEDDFAAITDFTNAIDKKCVKISSYGQVEILLRQLRVVHGNVKEHYASFGLDILTRIMVKIMVDGRASAETVRLLKMVEGEVVKPQPEKRERQLLTENITNGGDKDRIPF